MRWEYRIEKFTMPSNWIDGLNLEHKWDKMATMHEADLNRLGKLGWECYLNIGPLFYFKRFESDEETEKLEDKIKKLTFENNHAYDVGLPGLPPRNVDPQLYEDLGLE